MRKRTILLAAGALLALRRPLRNWGSTRGERAADWPGDDLIDGVRIASTMATTLPAPPEQVWPWLTQMGADRAGFYSWDRLDNGGRPSAETIHPEWQDLATGGRVLAVPSGTSWFDVALADPPRTLVLRASLALPSARPYDPAGPVPQRFSDSVWAFHLRPADGGATRLVVRSGGRNRPRALALANLGFWDPAHVVMQVRQFQGLRRRVDRQSSAPR